MAERHEAPAQDFVGDALSALRIGIWSWRGSPANVKCCSMAARLFGVPMEEARNGLSLDRFIVGIHPEDRASFSCQVDRAMQNGGPFVAEYRTLDEVGTTRLIVDRGEFELGPCGSVVAARGVVVDMTGRPRGIGIEGTFCSEPPLSSLPPLHQAVEHALALHNLINVLPEGWRSSAEVMIRSVLEMLGREVAVSLEQDGHHPAHQQRNMH